jgi:hypothetical protein
VGTCIYDCSDAKQTDLYTNTTKEIADYVGTNYKYGGDVRLVIDNLAEPTLKKPSNPSGDADETDRELWKLQVKNFFLRQGHLEENIKMMYSLIWGQCTEAMRAKVQSTQLYSAMSSTFDAVELLKTLKDVVFSFQDQKYGPQALAEAKKRFSLLTQDKHMTCQHYLEKFKNAVQVTEHCGGDIGVDNGLVNATLASALPPIMRSNATAAQVIAAEEYSHEQYLTCLFILGSDRGRYAILIEDLENEFTQKVDKWPKTLIDAYSFLVYWKKKNIMRMMGTGSDGVAFANVEDEEEYSQAHVNSKEGGGSGRGSG